MKLALKNNTRYRTQDLRKLFLECMRREGMQRARVTVNYSKRGRVHGRAWFNTILSEMFLPKSFTKWVEGKGYVREQIKEFTPEQVEDIAQVFRHELGHNLGLKHEDMVCCWHIDCSWARGFVVRLKEQKPAKRRDLVQERYLKAVRKVKEFECKVKRSKTLLDKWSRKVSYYEKKLVL